MVMLLMQGVVHSMDYRPGTQEQPGFKHGMGDQVECEVLEAV